MVRPSLELLRRAPAFRLLFLATLGSAIGSMLALIALAVDVFDRTGSSVWVAALLLADFLPMLAIGLLLGPVVDRFGRRRLMVAADLARCAAFLALPFAPTATVIVVLAGVVGFATGLFRPAVYAGLPRLVAEEDLPRANSLLQTMENLAMLLAPLAGGVLLTLWGPALPYTINAATFVVSAALLLRIPAALLPRGASGEGHWRDLAEGYRTVRRSRALLTVLIAWTVAMLGIGAINVAQVALAKVALGGGDFGLGVLVAASGLGLTLGSFIAGGWLERRPVSTVYPAAMATMGLGAVLTAGAPAMWAAAAALVIFGFGNGIAVVCNPLLVQRGASDRVRGRVFTVIMSTNIAFLGLSMAVAGPAVDDLGARAVFAAAGVVLTAAAATALVLTRGISLGGEMAVGEPVAVAPVMGARIGPDGDGSL